MKSPYSMCGRTIKSSSVYKVSNNRIPNFTQRVNRKKEKMLEKIKQCQICPRECRVNRLAGKVGNCKASDKIEISLVSLHPYEEPCIS